MVGIFGFFSQDVTETISNEIVNAMKEEDYCTTEQILNRSCFLGKLDIKSTGIEEAITKKEDEISIVTCGEVYNEDIENLDKAILKLYNKERLDKIKNFNGSFAAAIYDSAKEKLTLVNDRYGLIKLFYYCDKDRFCFAPKIRPLLKLRAEKTLRKDAIVEFFLFGYLLGDKTFFEHIHQLPPASILEISKKGIKHTKYWDYEYDEKYNARPKDELIDELGALWQKAVERRIKKDEKIIIPLSGGLDSRAILAAALRCTTKDNIITFTFGEKGSFDFEIGRMVAEKAGVRNIPLEAEKKDFEEQYNISMVDIEGMVDATPYFAVMGYAEIKNYGDNLYNGYMGDPIMGSHISAKMLNKKLTSKQYYIDAKSIIFEKHKLNDLDDVRKLFNPSYMNSENLKYSFERTLDVLKENHNEDVPNYCAIWDYIHRQNKYTMFTVFRYRELFKYSTPFLDNELVDFMLRIPPGLRLDENLYKSMLLKKYPELFELPTKTNSGLRLDAGITSLFLKRAILFSKMNVNKISSMLIKRNIFLSKGDNYIGYDDLIRRNKEYRGFMRKLLNKVEEREYFNRDYIEEVWRLHIQGKKNYAMFFGLLVTFELFLERFVDD